MANRLIAAACWALLSVQPVFAEVAPEAKELVDRIFAAQAEDSQRWSSLRCIGTIKFEKSDGSVRSVWDVEFRRQGRNLWLEYRLRREESNVLAVDDYDVVRVIGDGETLVAAKFSPRIRPGGCQAEAWLDKSQNFSLAAVGGRIDPRVMFLPPVARGKEGRAMYDTDKAAVTLDPNADDQNSLLVVLKNGTYWRIRSSPDFGHRIVRAELGDRRQPDRPSLILEYDWQQAGDKFEPRQIVSQNIDFAGGGYHVQRLVIEALEDRLEDAQADFSMAALKLFERTILLDRRPETKLIVRNVDLQTVDDPENRELTLTEMIEKFPLR